MVFVHKKTAVFPGKPISCLQTSNDEEVHVGDLGRRVEFLPQELGQEGMVLVFRRFDDVRRKLRFLRWWWLGVREAGREKGRERGIRYR